MQDMYEWRNNQWEKVGTRSNKPKWKRDKRIAEKHARKRLKCSRNKHSK